MLVENVQASVIVKLKTHFTIMMYNLWY